MHWITTDEGQATKGKRRRASDDGKATMGKRRRPSDDGQSSSPLGLVPKVISILSQQSSHSHPYKSKDNPSRTGLRLSYLGYLK
ncbi:hypothetical protein E5676_scaffold119G00570 [Cucumis melo var. makuwa]|uniref:Uncharacterized protein n=1 Tax=Cucumis melo var. makuwa TaxID=1194695 RepID=A0A5D3D4U6_CUCMM|nr:hypothetical protein E6C27_scaffold22G002990 [Cucumis melo var. makuwa]TYK18554.1 hypothetical protein E5676_scaffold119G00570 [Cucumis melo var. makuwa]